MGIAREHLKTPARMDIMKPEGQDLYICFQFACETEDAKEQEYMKKLKDGLIQFYDHVENIAIPPLIDAQLTQCSAGTKTDDDMANFFTAFNTTFSDVNECIPRGQQISGLPGSNILNSFLMRKIMGENVNAQTLQLELSQNGLIRNESTCNMADVLATYYIDKCLRFKPDKEPNLYWQPPEL